jgi:hypothetical protein
MTRPARVRWSRAHLGADQTFRTGLDFLLDGIEAPWRDASMTQTQHRVTFRKVFGVAEFRWMWFAELWSIAGDQLARVALWFMVFQATGSSALTGLTYGLTFAPSLLGGVLLTGIADRFRRREVMVVVDVLRGGLVLVVAIPGLPF